ncbi:BatD family protein [Chitinophaga sp. sic0106]|uniref:BatD family protein n=1 Tax=Chitinophaga sp. sic0106 TaxID=2854785 RepID=UPI001C463CE6|nr:BatD family protein [Chitinophaga sp. sic0106]MBV7529597.1 BatD family protein [Chitinophaga sp. sic0106]
MVRIGWIIVFLCIQVQLATAQVQCFAQVELDKTEVYVQQPVKVTFTVLTATWYTQPLEFDNLQVPQAFIVPFTKSSPGRFNVNGKEYSGIQFYYLVFPYKSGSFQVPPIKITAVTPPEGSATSQTVVIHSPAKSFVVKPVPHTLPQGESWLVAADVQLTQRWNKAPDQLKVGDVIDRSVIVDVSGTLPQFIPELPDTKLSWASTYPKPATLKDTRNDVMANGERIQTTTYLLTGAGDFELPAIKISWWNPYAARMYSRSLPPVKLHVAENPSLGMMTTLKDSLAKTVAAASPQHKKGPKEFFGIPWYILSIYVAVGLLLLYIWVRWLTDLYGILKPAWLRYRDSEPWWYLRFKYGDNVFPDIYHWWDRFDFPDKRASIGSTLQSQQEQELYREFSQYARDIYGGGQPDKAREKALKEGFAAFRRRRLQHLRQKQYDFLPEEI